MIGVIIGSRKIGINPDNVATPIAASLGDLITLALLSGISWGLYLERGEAEATEGVTRVDPRVGLGERAVGLQMCKDFLYVLNHLVGAQCCTTHPPPTPPARRREAKYSSKSRRQQRHRGKYLRNIFLPSPADSYLPWRSKGERLKERSLGSAHSMEKGRGDSDFWGSKQGHISLCR